MPWRSSSLTGLRLAGTATGRLPSATVPPPSGWARTRGRTGPLETDNQTDLSGQPVHLAARHLAWIVTDRGLSRHAGRPFGWRLPWFPPLLDACVRVGVCSNSR